MTGQGGWPLNVFLTPDQAPFFGGTYWPPVPPPRDAELPRGARGGRRAVARAPRGGRRRRRRARRAPRRRRRARARRRGRSTRTCSRARSPRSSSPSTARNGGFGGAPKFPPHCALELLAARRRARHARRDAARDGARGHQRPGRRRLRALRGRRHLDGPPLREDALRQRAARARLPARVAGLAASRSSSAPPARRSTSACASSPPPTAASTPRWTPTPRASRAASTSGRSTELREELGELAPAAIEYFGASERGNFEGANVLEARGPEPAGARARSARGCSPRARGARARRSTTSASRPGTR